MFSLEKTTSGVSGSSLASLHVARVVLLFRKSQKSLNKKPPEVIPGVSNWVQGLDLNQRPSGYEPDELPGCSTLQQNGRRKVLITVGTVNAFFQIFPNSRLPVTSATGVLAGSVNGWSQSLSPTESITTNP
jgi:hypothetical protein